MNKELIEKLKPLLNTRPMFGVFALGDGSGKYFCAACGAMQDPPLASSAPLLMVASVTFASSMEHNPGCGERAHWRAIEALKTAVAEAESGT